MSSGMRGDLIGRLMGMLVFLLGVGLLIGVFVIAYHLFMAPPAEALGLHFTGDPKKDPGAALIGSQFGFLLLRISLLFLMSLSGSFVAQKGINLYHCSSAMAAHGPALPASPSLPAITPPQS